MSASLIDRVRERLAAESVPLQATAVAAAIRAESGGLLGDAEVLSSLERGEITPEEAARKLRR